MGNTQTTIPIDHFFETSVTIDKEKNVYVRYWTSPELQDKLRITVGTAEQNDILLSELRNIL